MRAYAADAARQARGVLAALADPDDELTATPATRNRLEGTALVLETVARRAAGELTYGAGVSVRLAVVSTGCSASARWTVVCVTVVK